MGKKKVGRTEIRPTRDALPAVFVEIAGNGPFHPMPGIAGGVLGAIPAQAGRVLGVLPAPPQVGLDLVEGPASVLGIGFPAIAIGRLVDVIALARDVIWAIHVILP